MGQFPGVNIPVYVIGQSAYYKFKDILSANDIDPIKIELDVEGPSSSELEFQLWYSPDQTKAIKFMLDLFGNNMGRDLGVNINLEQNFVLWHCEECEDKGFKVSKAGCWSGGRYCYYKSDSSQADFYLHETLQQICLNKILLDSNEIYLRPKQLEDFSNYYSKYLDTISAKNKNLSREWLYAKELSMNDELKDKIKKCFNSSFTPSVEKKITPMLDDNKYLKEELQKFKSVGGFDNFP